MFDKGAHGFVDDIENPDIEEYVEEIFSQL